MRALHSEGPAVVWVRFGNTTKRQFLVRFGETLPSIISALERHETVIELSAS
jgi:predicted nuclease of predicted toxin-antitoxin system